MRTHLFYILILYLMYYFSDRMESCEDHPLSDNSSVYDSKMTESFIISEPVKCRGTFNAIELYAFDTGEYIIQASADTPEPRWMKETCRCFKGSVVW